MKLGADETAMGEEFCEKCSLDNDIISSFKNIMWCYSSLALPKICISNARPCHITLLVLLYSWSVILLHSCQNGSSSLALWFQDIFGGFCLSCIFTLFLLFWINVFCRGMFFGFVFFYLEGGGVPSLKWLEAYSKHIFKYMYLTII